jgi:hypothetical protein
VLHDEAAKERELMEDSLSSLASWDMQRQAAGEGANLCCCFFLLLELEMDLIEVFLDTIWPLLFWAVMLSFLKPLDATSEESDDGGIADDVSTNKSSRSSSCCSCWEDRASSLWIWKCK